VILKVKQPEKFGGVVPNTTLTLRDLNRATLARQMLLAREKTTALSAIERLAGMQAQLPRPPFVGLWTRVADFRREDLAQLLRGRKVVRATLMRATLHLMSAKDYASLRPAIQPALTRVWRQILRQRAHALDPDALAAAAREFLAEGPRTFQEIRAHLAATFPKGDERAMGYIVRTHLPLVQVPTEAEWAFPNIADFTPADAWLGKRRGAGDENPQALILRYLSAFGPATPGDAQTWSGLAGLRDAFESLRPKLRTFRDERGRELFDLPNAPRPGGDAPAPVRFLPDYDNLLLAHADRTRVVANAHRAPVFLAAGRIMATFLVNGFVAGTWKIARTKRAATLKIAPFAPLPKSARAELVEEAETLVRFVEADAEKLEIAFA